LAAACLSSQPVRHRIGCRLFVGLEGRNPRDRCFIPYRFFWVNFPCVLFLVSSMKKILTSAASKEIALSQRFISMNIVHELFAEQNFRQEKYFGGVLRSRKNTIKVF
jgi:hypothetical protein